MSPRLSAALLHDGQPVEVFFERPREGISSGIFTAAEFLGFAWHAGGLYRYRSRCRNGFLYVNDAVLDLEARRSNDDEESRADVRGAPVADIAEVLKAGQEILVQIQKEPLGTKGARLTSTYHSTGTVLGKDAFQRPYWCVAADRNRGRADPIG